MLDRATQHHARLVANWGTLADVARRVDVFLGASANAEIRLHHRGKPVTLAKGETYGDAVARLRAKIAAARGNRPGKSRAG